MDIHSKSKTLSDACSSKYFNNIGQCILDMQKHIYKLYDIRYAYPFLIRTKSLLCGQTESSHLVYSVMRSH